MSNFATKTHQFMTRTIRLRITTTLVLVLFSVMADAQTESWKAVADAHHLAAYLVAALQIGVFVMIFSNRLYYFKEQEVNNRAKQLNTHLALVLNANKTQIWTYDKKNIFTMLSGETVSRTDFAPIDFSQFYDHEDFEVLRGCLNDVMQKNSLTEKLLVKDHNGEKIYEISISVLKRDQHYLPEMLLGIQRDITESKRRDEKTQNLSMQYQTVFNSSLVDMIYYGADGRLLDLNEKACETFMIEDRNRFLKRHIHFNDIPSYRYIDINDLYDNVRLSSITDIDEVVNSYLIKKAPTNVDVAYTVKARYNDGRVSEGQTVRFNIAITEMVESHHKQEEEAQLLLRTNKQIQAYIRNINYTLRTSGVRMITYHPRRHELCIYSDLNKIQYRLQQIRCASLIHPSDQSRARGLMLRMDRGKAGNISEVLRTVFHDNQGRDVYLHFNLFPQTDKDGNVSHYFGMFRNETEMKYTEMRLIEETKKAQETEELKNTFLLNMSYEIRTPLNAVLGFAELFNAPHDMEDEPVFAEEIKRNTDDLLKLVNDILFMSRLDAKMVEFTKEETDFATLFDGWCYIGWSARESNAKPIVENPYEHLVVKIDQQHLGEVIQKICTYSPAYV